MTSGDLAAATLLDRPIGLFVCPKGPKGEGGGGGEDERREGRKEGKRKGGKEGK